MADPFRHALRVRYAECDAQGVVFNAHYLAYFDINMTELWRAAFGGYQAMLDRGLDIVVAEAQLHFRASARFDDLITLEVSVARLGTTSIVTDHAVLRDGLGLVHGRAGRHPRAGGARRCCRHRSGLAGNRVPGHPPDGGPDDR